MPILKREVNVFPDDIFSAELPGEWRVIYTRSNREKDIMRRMLALELPFFCPMIEKKWRSPNGRQRTSFAPLFSNYVFTIACEDQRYQILRTNCVSTIHSVSDQDRLILDLKNLASLIDSGAPVTLEEQIRPGQMVRVKSGPFTGCEGVVVQRRGKRRLLVQVQFLEQAVSAELNDFLVESI